jgi:uncharacterized protein YfbU (UPF0304 family)
MCRYVVSALCERVSPRVLFTGFTSGRPQKVIIYMTAHTKMSFTPYYHFESGTHNFKEDKQAEPWW